MSALIETYLGDGAYAEFNGYNITIYTSDGISRTNTVHFEPEVTEAFERFVSQVRAYCEEQRRA
jgi:hypothetical protein